MIVHVRLFATLRERAGTGAVDVELGAGATAADAMRTVAESHGLADMLSSMRVGVAVNRAYADPGAPLRDGDELALIPPVSGGAPDPRVHARVTGDALSADRLVALVGSPAAGAIVTFHGVTRDVDRLDYDAYEEMAGPMLERILREVADEHALIAIAAEHRIGPVPLGEPSVIVAASSGHRPEAFAGARAAIDRIKAEVPIWKREVERNGDTERARWVEGTPVDGLR